MDESFRTVFMNLEKAKALVGEAYELWPTSELISCADTLRDTCYQLMDLYDRRRVSDEGVSRRT